MTYSEEIGIRLEIHTPLQIFFPSQVVYSIPQINLGLNTPIIFGINLFNNTSNYVQLHPLQPIIPELITSEKQTIQRRLVTNDSFTNNEPIFFKNDRNNRLGFWRILPNYSSRFNLLAKLIWENNILQLQIPTFPNFLPNSPKPDSSWCFDGLEAKNYQIRFHLNTNRENILSSESNIPQDKAVEETNLDILATPWLNFRLIQPLFTDSCAIEVDKVTFKIKMPKLALTIPNKRTEAKTDVKLGIQVTNNTSNSLRFYERGSIDVILMDDDGKQISTIPEVKIPGITGKITDNLVEVGKSTFINLDGIISWRNKNMLQLAIPRKTKQKFIGSYSYFCFGELALNQRYHLHLTYRIPENASYLQEEVLEKVWTGSVTLPPVQFTLVEP